MREVISIRFAEDASWQAADFLRAWERFGSHRQIAGHGYELRSPSGDALLLTCTGAALQITGNAQDDTYSFIKQFAASSGGELLHEGELFGKSVVVQSEALEGEFIRGGDHRDAMDGGEPMRGRGAPGGQAAFGNFKLKPVPKAVAITAIAIFFPIALAFLLLFMLAMFGRLAFRLLRLPRRG